ncbi:hypothetical protein HOD71_00390 [Candidatus Peribacteria bacterium]|mgnify:FL=1|nr:hypothetical protein [Candidatus Peribacteria bacterium]MBT4240343.1 hypothetical protein [Candidatus Peribacteria bacterium]
MGVHEYRWPDTTSVAANTKTGDDHRLFFNPGEVSRLTRPLDGNVLNDMEICIRNVVAKILLDTRDTSSRHSSCNAEHARRIKEKAESFPEEFGQAVVDSESGYALVMSSQVFRDWLQQVVPWAIAKVSGSDFDGIAQSAAHSRKEFGYKFGEEVQVLPSEGDEDAFELLEAVKRGNACFGSERNLRRLMAIKHAEASREIEGGLTATEDKICRVVVSTMLGSKSETVNADKEDLIGTIEELSGEIDIGPKFAYWISQVPEDLDSLREYAAGSAIPNCNPSNPLVQLANAIRDINVEKHDPAEDAFGAGII